MTDYLQIEKDEEIISTSYGVDYVKDNYRRAEVPAVVPLMTNTLQSVVEFVNSHEWDDLVIHIRDEKSIFVYSDIKFEEECRRDHFLTAVADVCDLTLDRFMDLEDFNLMMQSCFVESESRAEILACIGSVEDVNSRTLNDDGISQSITVKTGVTTKSKALVPNPVTLMPYKTFSEIEQPNIQYIFRMGDGPRALLRTVGNPTWRVETIKKIKAYLIENINNENIVILA